MIKITTKRFDATDEEVIREMERLYPALYSTGFVTVKAMAKALKCPEYELRLVVLRNEDNFLTFTMKSDLVIRAIIRPCKGKFKAEIKVLFDKEITVREIICGPFVRTGFESSPLYLIDRPSRITNKKNISTTIANEMRLMSYWGEESHGGGE